MPAHIESICEPIAWHSWAQPVEIAARPRGWPVENA